MSDTREEDLMRCLAQGGAGTIEKKVREVGSDNVRALYRCDTDSLCKIVETFIFIKQTLKMNP